MVGGEDLNVRVSEGSDDDDRKRTTASTFSSRRRMSLNSPDVSDKCRGRRTGRTRIDYWVYTHASRYPLGPGLRTGLFRGSITHCLLRRSQLHWSVSELSLYSVHTHGRMGDLGAKYRVHLIWPWASSHLTFALAHAVHALRPVGAIVGGAIAATWELAVYVA